MKAMIPRALIAALLALIAFAPLHAAPAAPLLIEAARVFDGERFHTDAAILIENGRVTRIDAPREFAGVAATRLDLGEASVLPGFIELHAHTSFRHIPADVVLAHGITTVRDLGGPLHPPRGGDGRLRVLTSGPILTAPGGYPIPAMGEAGIARPVANSSAARRAVRELVAGGAVVIKVALEPGGEAGAPWAGGHAHGHGHEPAGAGHGAAPHEAQSVSAGWPLLSADIVAAIVAEAHRLDRRVSAHLAEPQGVTLALDAGVDEWAHLPCAPIPEPLLRRAVAQGVKIVTTLDTLSRCPGIAQNARTLAALGADLYYGAEIAHPDIPWGIDAEELNRMRQWGGLDALAVLQTATAKAGRLLGIPLLGTLEPGAPADLIAITSDPVQDFKPLEYPALVVSGGQVIFDRLTHSSPQPPVD